MTAISTRGLSKRYGRLTALDDVTFDVAEGEVFGFLGPNGAGKTTAIRTLLGFLRPSAGHASVLGLDCVRESTEIRRRVGYLPGGVALYDSLTGLALLDYLARLSGRPPTRRAELCDRLELPEATLRRPVRDYSRGMRQKLGIVQALQHDPELAILDEPSEGLDPLMQVAFYGALADLARAGRTVFFSSHILSEVERVCTKVAIVRAGRLMTVADVATLLARRQRRVEARVRGAMPDLRGVPGVHDVRVDGAMLSARLDGEVGPFLDAIHASDVVDLAIVPASLEEAFLEYYAPDGGGTDGDGRPDGDGRSAGGEGPGATIAASGRDDTPR